MNEPIYQIYEADLSLLEREIPSLMDSAAGTCNDPLTRKRWEAIKTVLSNVRWNYGPYLMVQAEEEPK